jgi:Cft2 family RNA processing exonuclease
MTRLAFLLAGACVVALFSFGTAADDQPEAKKTGAALVADRVWWGAEFELTLTAPDTGEKFQRTREGVVWDHLVFSNCFATDGKGSLVAVVRFPKTKDEFTLRSLGPAEDLYALQICQLEKTFPKLHKKLVDGAKEIKLLGRTFPVAAHIELIDSMSAHADYSESLRWLSGFTRPPAMTYLVHGDPVALAALASRITAEKGWPVHIAGHLERVELTA